MALGRGGNVPIDTRLAAGSTSVMVTVAMPSGLRSRVPAKMTSSMRAPRRDLADCSPEHPTNGVAQVGLSAPVRAHDGGNAAAIESQLGPVAKGLKALDLDAFSFSKLLTSSARGL